MKSTVKLSVVLLLLGFVTNVAFAQKITINGVVTDLTNSEPVSGVSVFVKGKVATGTITNDNGQYQTDATIGDMIVFTHIAYHSTELRVSKTGTYSIELMPIEGAMDAVVVTGYGQINKSDVTGSIGKVNVEELQKAPVRSFDEALAGRVAGVQVTSQDGMPGTPIDIVIRGTNSINGDNSPLYVVDGVPMEDFNTNSINPQEIENIDILKDASYTALYGARGANGVIVITTKRGKLGAPLLTYTASAAFDKVIKTMPVLGPYDYVLLQFSIDSARARQNYLGEDISLESYRNAPGVNWQEQMFRPAFRHNHNFSVSGGNTQTRYFISGSYLQQEGTLKHTGYERYQAKINLDQQLTKRLKSAISTNFSGTKQTGSRPSNPDIASYSTLFYLANAIRYRPVSRDVAQLLEELMDDEVLSVENTSTITDGRAWTTNPLTELRNQYRVNYSNALQTSGYLEYLLVEGLKLRGNFGFNYIVNRNDAFNNSKSVFGRESLINLNGVNGSRTHLTTLTSLREYLVIYDKNFNKIHRFNFTGGYKQERFNTNVSGHAAFQLPNESLGINGLDEGTPSSITETSTPRRLNSYLGRIMYNFNSKYYFTGTFRAEGSSLFTANNRWGYFPAAGVSWRIKNEPFLKNSKIISEAKLRASYGKTGNNRISAFAYATRINFGRSTGYPFDNTFGEGSAPSNLMNPNIKWETTDQYDYGIELGFLKNRITFEGEYYKKITYDLLLNANLPGQIGFTTAFKNIGRVQNSGLEFTINTKNIVRKNFSWASSFNIAFNRNKLLQLTENQEFITSIISWNYYFRQPAYIARLGQPLGQFYGAIFDGVYQVEDFYLQDGGYLLKDEIPGNGATRASIQPGHARYKDLNGDLGVTVADYTVIGQGVPMHIGGLSNTFTYKGFDLSVFFQWSYGNDVINANRLQFEESYNYGPNMFATIANRWTFDNQESNMPYSYRNYYNTRIVEDASFLRLKTLALSYAVAPKLLKGLKLKAFKLGVSAQNLITWTNYTGYDPEVSVRNSALTPGFDYSAYPRARTINLNLSATF